MNADTAFRAAKHAVATLLAVLAFGGVASAQDWPTKTVRIVVPFGPGSTPDVVARLVADGLQQKYPASVFVVENKPGASGNLGTDIVAKAVPDGSTLGVSIGGPLAINALLFSRLPYDPRKDIEPITQLIIQPSVLAVNPALGVNSVAELVALLRKNPSKYNFASIGNGSLSHRHGSDRAQSRRPVGARALPQFAAGHHGGDPQRCADRLSSGDSGHPAGRNGRRQDSRRLYRAALSLFAGRADAEGKRHRCGSRCLERSDHASRHAQANHRPDQQGRRRYHPPADVAREIGNPIDEPVGSSPDELRARMDAEIERWAPVIKAANVTLN
jgi:hypothetical protein